MKNPFLFLIFFLITAIAQAQDIAWIKNTFQTGTDSLTAVQKVTEMAKLAGLKFIKKVDKTPKYAGYYFADTTKKMDTPPQAIFKIYKTQVGANEDLGRAGETQFFVSEDILGSFLGLFPIWKNYIKPESDAENISNERFDNLWVKNGLSRTEGARLDKNSDMSWTIRIYTNKFN